MLGYESERRLKALIIAVADGELSLERSRQRLCEIKDMAPRSLFERLDRDANNYISSFEILEYLRQNGVYGVSENECYQLVKFFDSDEDGRLSFQEYLILFFIQCF